MRRYYKIQRDSTYPLHRCHRRKCRLPRDRVLAVPITWPLALVCLDSFLESTVVVAGPVNVTELAVQSWVCSI